MIGIDIISIARMQKFVEKFGTAALERFLCEKEIALCINANETINIPRVAGFWAAKEACSKALGVGIGSKLSFLDMHISKSSTNVPSIHLVSEKISDFNIKNIALSISHDGGFAIAVVVII
ncbi:holo-ACP synthase [Helicobacter sp. MIT 21-1697]|uniref:holo-ACP synthase n=1 Tax=Helicobacter sp. MIT 21-1697 TaxID=2993733 RepID=UPI00224B5BD3|nr:holo-ACP synthase [Helicobacter sp. MIT 21-1697]MCX2717641.1 holo-ACP synthase [Helicobacter sp. MIT 21-1697]